MTAETCHVRQGRTELVERFVMNGDLDLWNWWNWWNQARSEEPAWKKHPPVASILQKLQLLRANIRTAIEGVAACSYTISFNCFLAALYFKPRRLQDARLVALESFASGWRIDWP